MTSSGKNTARTDELLHAPQQNDVFTLTGMILRDERREAMWRSLKRACASGGCGEARGEGEKGRDLVETLVAR